MVIMFPKVAEELRESIHKETGLTCSAGVAPNRLLAKVLSNNIKDTYLLGCLIFTGITQYSTHPLYVIIYCLTMYCTIASS